MACVTLLTAFIIASSPSLWMQLVEARRSARYSFVKLTPRSHISFTKYNSNEEINAYLDYLSLNYQGLVRVETIGWSVEGRPIRAVKVSTGGGGSKPALLIDAGIHAREWIAPAVALYALQELVEDYDANRQIVNAVDFFIIPQVNPDGYEYSMTVNRLWRKNKALTTDPKCPGVDLNRNFDILYAGLGSGLDPCNETYIGNGPFSEPESRALRNFMLVNKHQIQMYLTLHSFGQYLLYPWGFDNILPSDWQDLDQVAKLAENALSSLYGTHYKVGSSAHLLGAAAGGSDDWIKARAGVKYSYTIELPGGGEQGFDLPPQEIFRVVSETFEAIKLFGRFIGHFL